MQSANSKWWALFILNGIGLVGFYAVSQGSAAPPATKQPFANSVEQRERMIRLLQESNDLLREQNTILKSKVLRVEVVEKSR